jgi:hypothetical protein
MTCDEILRWLEAGEPLSGEASRHISECPTCASHQLAEALMRRYGRRQLTAPDDLVDSVMGRLERTQPTVIREIWRFAAAAAAVVAIVLTGWFAFRSEVEPVVGELTAQVDTNIESVRGLTESIGARVKSIWEVDRDSN